MDAPDVQVTTSGHWDDLWNILINGETAEYWSSCRRTFYRAEGFIVKVDSTSDETPEAENEMEIWDKLDEEDRQHFVPILCGSVDEGWVCQEYLEIKHSPKLEQKLRNRLWKEIIEPLSEKYYLYDVTHQWNWGLVNGIPMIYDYGE